eukprot:3751710-Pyramimonas_sp.AAC.1
MGMVDSSRYGHAPIFGTHPLSQSKLGPDPGIPPARLDIHADGTAGGCKDWEGNIFTTAWSFADVASVRERTWLCGYLGGTLESAQKLHATSIHSAAAEFEARCSGYTA